MDKVLLWLHTISDTRFKKTTIRQCSFVFAFVVGSAWIKYNMYMHIVCLSEINASFHDVSSKKRYIN